MMRASATLSKSRSLLTEACTTTRSSRLMSSNMSDRCLHRDASLRPLGSRVSSNVGVARRLFHTFSILTGQRSSRTAGCFVHTPRRLQQIAISCERSCYNNFFKKKKLVKNSTLSILMSERPKEVSLFF